MSMTSRLFVPFFHFIAGGSNHIGRTYDQPVAARRRQPSRAPAISS